MSKNGMDGLVDGMRHLSYVLLAAEAVKVLHDIHREMVTIRKSVVDLEGDLLSVRSAGIPVVSDHFGPPGSTTASVATASPPTPPVGAPAPSTPASPALTAAQRWAYILALDAPTVSGASVATPVPSGASGQQTAGPSGASGPLT